MIKSKNKTLIILACVFTISAGWISYQYFFNTSLDFEKLTVDLNDAKAIGIGVGDLDNAPEAINKLGIRNQRYSSENSDTFLPYLATEDEEGNLSKVEFLDDNGNPVDIPHYLISSEVIGSFTYLIYLDTKKIDFIKTGLGGNDGTGNVSLRPNFFAQFMIKPFYSRPISESLNAYEIIIIHNPSGKIFDLKNIVMSYYKDSSSPDSRLLHLIGVGFERNEDGFSFFTTNSNFQGLEGYTPETCLHNFSFSLEELNFNVSDICAPISYFPYAVSSARKFIYSVYISGRPVLNIYDILTTEIKLYTGSLSPGDYYPQFYERNGMMIGYVEFSNEKTTVCHDLNFNEIQCVGNTNEKELTSNGFPFFGTNEYSFRENEILKRSMVDGTTTSILESENPITYETNNLKDFLLTGVVKYSIPQGFSRLHYKIDVLSGTAYLQNESLPSLRTSVFSPIN
jgi:hypothetical protein